MKTIEEVLEEVSRPISPLERINMALRLERPDRVPIAPVITLHTPPDLRKAEENFEKIFTDLGGCDGFFFWPLTLMTGRTYTPCKLGAREAMIIMKDSNGYDELIGEGFIGYISRVYKEQDIDEDIEKAVISAAEKTKTFAQKWEEERKVPLYAGALGIVPFGFLAYARGFTEIAKDIVRYPWKIVRACNTIVDDMTNLFIKLCTISNVRRIWLSFINSTPESIGTPHFSSFVWPTAKIMIEQLIDAKILPILQFDVNAYPIFNYLKELPKEECILHLDSSTDIIKAKENIGNHMCIMGNVSLLKFTNKEDVRVYCRNLIDKLGKEGGFILSSDNPIVIDEEPIEKVKAITDAIKTL
ncbi:MAG: uroporphyrinogen decarboxylase family protein [Nitrososphaerales archaeon]